MNSVKIGGGLEISAVISLNLLYIKDLKFFSLLLCKNLIKLDRYSKFDECPRNFFSFSFKFCKLEQWYGGKVGIYR